MLLLEPFIMQKCKFKHPPKTNANNFQFITRYYGNVNKSEKVLKM